MKIHDVDLLEILPALAAWDALSPAVRGAWVQADGNRTTKPGVYGDDEDRMLAAGLLDATATGLRRVGRGALGLRTVLRAAQGCAVLTPDADGTDALLEYVQATYTQVERAALLADSSYYGWDVAQELARRAASRGWVQGLLAARPATWVKRHSTDSNGENVGWSRRLTPTVHTELDRIVRDVAEAGGTVSLRALLEDSDRRRRSTKTKALEAALRYLVLFPRLAPDQVRLEVGLVPAVATALAEADVGAPRVEDVELDAGPPFWIDDMVAVLLNTASGEARVKAGGARAPPARRSSACSLRSRRFLPWSNDGPRRTTSSAWRPRSWVSNSSTSRASRRRQAAAACSSLLRPGTPGWPRPSRSGSPPSGA